MHLTLTRRWPGSVAILGELAAAGAGHFCWTLEPPARGEHPAIPAGRYAVALTESARAAAGTLWSPAPPLLPLVADVPGRTGIRIHAGNTAADTVGCILVGLTNGGGEPRLGSSRLALAALVERLREPGPHTLEIVEPT